jgi:hypothetical protein
LAKILKGVKKLSINKKAVFTTTKNKKNCYDDDKKIKKSHHGTPCSRQPAAKSPRTKAQRRRVCVNTTVLHKINRNTPFFD